jgi:hypothetical protein
MSTDHMRGRISLHSGNRRWLTFIHDEKTNEIKVISQYERNDIFLGTDIIYRRYNIFFSQNKKLICDCPHGIFEESFCSHRKELIKLIFKMKDPTPIVKMEFTKLLYYEIDCSAPNPHKLSGEICS